MIKNNMKKIELKIRKIVEELTELKKDKKDYWPSGSRFIDIRNMTNDDTGEVGEMLLDKVFSENGYKVDFDKGITNDEKDWDIIINDIKIEVKTATIGKSTPSFQHENFAKNRSYDAVAFIEFTSEKLYVIFALKKDILWDKLHARKVNGMYTNMYKFDLTLKKIMGKDIDKLQKYFVSEIKTENDLMILFNQLEEDFHK